MDLRTNNIFPRTPERIFHWCPVCGAPMYEAERLSEDRCVFVWYECSAKDCEGQWLEKQAVNQKREKRVQRA